MKPRKQPTKKYEPSADVPAQPIITATPTPTASSAQLKAWLTKAPIVDTGVPELRWYGQFVIDYTAWLKEGKQLVE